MKLWAILKTVFFLVIVWSLARIIFQWMVRRPKPKPTVRQSKTIDLKEKGRGKLPDGSEYVEYEDVD